MFMFVNNYSSLPDKNIWPLFYKASFNMMAKFIVETLIEFSTLNLLDIFWHSLTNLEKYLVLQTSLFQNENVKGNSL